MSKNPIRKDKTCLNCKYVVDNRFCPNCGQENTETRKTFHHLFIHFIEDLTHYENAFWKTIRNLIFKPGSLTREYLSGKRVSYLAPFRLYIFISFVTFLLIAMLPDEIIFPASEFENGAAIELNPTAKSDSIYRNAIQDSINRITDSDKIRIVEMFGYESVSHIDSVQKYGDKKDRRPDWQYKILRKGISVMENNTGVEIFEKFKDSLFYNFPKVLFIYMPVFALVLWIFQDKRRWYYFDHGIFTLHYFSFLLLGFLIHRIIHWILDHFIESVVTDILYLVTNLTIIGYMLYYFFPAHHYFYQQSRGITIIKGILMFIINSFLAGIIMLAFIIYTFLNIH